METGIEEIKMTKKLQGYFDKYEVKLRDEPQAVLHEMKKTTCTVTPLQFGVYELALKAIALANYCANPMDYTFSGQGDWYATLFENSRILGPEYPHDSHINNRRIIESHSDVYRYCCRLLADAGLYYDLLD